MPCMRYAPRRRTIPGRRDIQPGARGMNERGRARAIARLYPHEHVGDGGLQAHELDALAPRPPGTVDDPPFDDRVGKSARPGLDEVACTHRGSCRTTGKPHAGGDRGAPHDVVAIGQRLGQLEVRRARFVRVRARVMRKDASAHRDSNRADAPTATRATRHGVAFGCTAYGVSGRNPRHVRETDLVMRPHRLERALPCGGALLVDPSRLDLRLDLVEAGDAPGRRGSHEDEMPAQARLDRSLPGSWLEPGRLQRQTGFRRSKRSARASDRRSDPET